MYKGYNVKVYVSYSCLTSLKAQFLADDYFSFADILSPTFFVFRSILVQPYGISYASSRINRH